MSLRLFERVTLFALLAGCQRSSLSPSGDASPAPRDLAFAFGSDGSDDGGPLGPPNDCGDNDPTCTAIPFQPGFPLQSDPKPDPGERDIGIRRDPQTGYLILDQTHATLDFLWIANSEDWNRGTVSKVNPRTMREVARYPSVTCLSNPGGTKDSCDGVHGCCTRDDNDRFHARLANQPEPAHQAVQLTMNKPSRTAVDWNNDVWIANRAFGGQSSVTKIANLQKDCVERNGAPGIQTSKDANGDGVIDTDCNRNGIPDDIDDIQRTPCLNNNVEEFLGADDECVLFTTNTGPPNQMGRPLALAPSTAAGVAADVWAGTYSDARFYRIAAASGLLVDQTQLPAIQPYGAVVDAAGILWATSLGQGGLSYFDTAKPSSTGHAREPNGFPSAGYGITIDREQNVWLPGFGSGSSYRYTPDRSHGFSALGDGWWSRIDKAGQSSGAQGGGWGIAADSRSPSSYFVWINNGNFLQRIDASALPVPKGFDTIFDGSAMPAIKVAGDGGRGVGLDVEQNVFTVNYAGSVVTRVPVDKTGAMKTPDTWSGSNDQGCPIGQNADRCTLGLDGVGTTPGPYTYSDFTGFGLRNFSPPKGLYAVQVTSACSGTTRWIRVEWDAEVPTGTTLGARARHGRTQVPDGSWSAFLPEAGASPLNLGGIEEGSPSFLQVEFDFATTDSQKSPRLHSFRVFYECRTLG